MCIPTGWDRLPGVSVQCSAICRSQLSLSLAKGLEASGQSLSSGLNARVG